jgi:ATPase subunit of ABC transporter with duplicated ATPase domains
VKDYGQLLYVRPCYLPLFNKVQAAWSSDKRVGVFGTPGIGKTFFLIYTFLRLVKEEKPTDTFLISFGNCHFFLGIFPT